MSGGRCGKEIRSFDEPEQTDALQEDYIIT